MSKVGSYKGVKWTYQPMRDFFIFGGKTKYYFTLNSKNELTGDCFKTLKELKIYVESNRKNKDAN